MLVCLLITYSQREATDTYSQQELPENNGDVQGPSS